MLMWGGGGGDVREREIMGRGRDSWRGLEGGGGGGEGDEWVDTSLSREIMY